MNKIDTYEEMEYRLYTGKSEFDKALSTLKGLVKGITIDGVVNKREVDELINWISLHEHLEQYLPFSELLPLIRNIVVDGIITADELQDLLWLCLQFDEGGKFYDLITLTMQELQGIVHGLLCDGELNDNEIKSINKWLQDNKILTGTYPYDEIVALLASIFEDGFIDEAERTRLIAYCSSFVDFSTSYNLNSADLATLREESHVSGICAKDPFIDIEDHTFCFTGKSSKCSRSEFEQVIAENDGIFNNNITKKTNYLLVGDDGNPCWAFNCYGRKVEKAIELRKQGSGIIIVHENDFWKLFDE